MAETKQHYIVPVNMLLALTIEAEEDGLNEKVANVVKELEMNDELRKDLYNWSKKITEYMEQGSAIFVPGAFIPIQDTNIADIAINFVNDLNAKMLETADNGQTEEE